MKINKVGDIPLKIKQAPVKGMIVNIEGEQFYKIENYERMAPFFMSIVSDSDHWLFLSSKGGLTAGRKNPENALFPYLTDDKIHDSSETTGSKTIIYIETRESFMLWEPFSDAYKGIYNIQRNIYKNSIGNKVIFEELNIDLQLSFKYCYCNSNKFGLIKRSTLLNLADFKRRINILDGLQNILPSSVNRSMQTNFSTLVDAYKKTELLAEEGIGIYALSSIPVDKAEPSEALQCTVAWSVGLDNASYLLSSNQLEKFRIERTVAQENEIFGTRGAYFACAQLELIANSSKEWYTAADVNKDASGILEIKAEFSDSSALIYSIKKDINRGSSRLVKIVANGDGIQLTADKLISSRHFSNVLFNAMRGGIFDDNYWIERRDFMMFVAKTNSLISRQYSSMLLELPEKILYTELRTRINNINDPQFNRILSEYLPLTFSRRHGDPSRPWNVFSIDILNDDGSKKLSYQGNWRDIFQNWEALAFSFPGFIENMIAKFVNASTADGYNPYRLMREGFEWEVLDIHDPWSNIGYWGDHQVIYLLRLLELSRKFHPGLLEKMMSSALFSYAWLPYRIKEYNELLRNPSESIVFDEELHRLIINRSLEFGSDGKLLPDKDGKPYLVNLGEKLLLLVLSKLSNFIPGGGIWMNTQRPEWNDANNALVGRGLSMVTLYYLRRFIIFFKALTEANQEIQLDISEEIIKLYKSISSTLINFQQQTNPEINDISRKKILDRLAKAGSDYRTNIYSKSFSRKKLPIKAGEFAGFCESALYMIDHSIAANRRADGLYHSYNLMEATNDKGISIINLYEMLEGQVALLSSGYANSTEALKLLELLRESDIYRADQASYMLYPQRRLQSFMEKNIISEIDLSRSELLQQLVKDNNKLLIIRDKSGKLHFNSKIRNSNQLKVVISNEIDGIYKELAEKEKDLILDIYENVFHHSAFTGRSGTFYKYEGLGSIYWHMVSKLQLAVSEQYIKAKEKQDKDELISGLREKYYQIKEGIGVHKSPVQYGAFPTDPYSHTPAHAGVQQPGMTGQVKEDILSRFYELGVIINQGCIQFDASLLKTEEFLSEAAVFNYFDLAENPQSIGLEKDMLAFTYCQVPVIYHRSDSTYILLQREDKQIIEIQGMDLDFAISQRIFSRDGYINRIDVYLKK